MDDLVAVTLQGKRQERLNGLLVVDEQDARGAVCHDLPAPRIVGAPLTSAAVLDVRVYRTAFLPALVALFIAAFALKDRPTPEVSPLPADSFVGNRAYGNEVNPAPESLLGMARDFPSREPGSSGDNALAARVARALRAPGQKGEGATFQVSRSTTE